MNRVFRPIRKRVNSWEVQMLRVIGAASVIGVLVAGCEGTGEGPEEPAGEDKFYTLYFDEVIELGEEWLGSSTPPSHYCVAVARGVTESALDESRDPDEAVLETLSQSNSLKSFHAYSSCEGRSPLEAPTGAPAGLLWVTPLEGRERLSGGWLASGDLTEWTCTFSEAAGVVGLQECQKVAES